MHDDMKHRSGRRRLRPVQLLRIASQTLATLFFITLVVLAGLDSPSAGGALAWFFYTDPLLGATGLLVQGAMPVLFGCSLVLLLLTLFLGRFFCGWICPLGAIHQCCSFLAAKPDRLPDSHFSRKLRKVKFLVLIAVLAAALAGTPAGVLLDPFTLLVRSITASLEPAGLHLAKRVTELPVPGFNPAPAGAKPAITAGKPVPGPWPPAHTQGTLIGFLFLLTLGMNFFQRRFYCNTLCPLGALYGWVARRGRFRLKVEPGCRSCRQCGRNCTYSGNPVDEYSRQDCVVCFNCVADCPSGSIRAVQSASPGQPELPAGLSRRQVLGSAAAGCLLAALPQVSGPASIRTRDYLRPPGALPEDEFLKKCTRCGICIQVCPTGFIQPAFLETGLDGIWTPVLRASHGYCRLDCNACTPVCPAGALQPLPLADKKQFKLGTAVVDKNRCYTYADGINCTVCRDRCPVPDKAIRYRPARVLNYQGEPAETNQIYVVPDLCNGCGLCEHVCPRTDAPGIRLTSEEEQRESGYGRLYNN